MSVLRYFIIMLVSTLLCWAALILVVFCIDPFNSGWIGILCFYFSLFLAVLGSLALLGFGARIVFKKDELAYKMVGISLRQGLLFSILVACSLLLASQNLFTWWSILILVFGLGALELFFLSRSISKFNK